MEKGVLIRLNELALKSDKKQSFFVDKFISSLKDAFSRNALDDFQIFQLGYTFFVSFDEPELIVPILKNIPGVELFAITNKFSFDSFDSLLEQASVLVRDNLKNKSFRVTSRRFGKHSFSSMQLSADLGERLMPFAKSVDLHNPDVTVFMEVRNNDCYLHLDWLKGLGGLPAGSSGKALVLFSGGIDCPVAMFQMLRKGVLLDSIFVNMTGDSVRNSVLSVYNFVLDKFVYSYTPKLFEVDGSEIVSYLSERVPNSLRQQALKIIYYSLAKALLKKTGSWAVVTGEALSQKSSQTIQSLDLIQYKVSPLLVLRPLIAYDKNEIINIARSIGTFASSSLVKEQCNISSGRVTAVPHPKDFDRIPDLSDLIDSLLSKIIVHEGLVDLDFEDSSLEVPFSSDNFLLIDLRSRSDIIKNPLPNSIPKSFDVLKDDFSFFDKKYSYVLVCSFGVQSKELALRLRKKGFSVKAFSFKEFIKSSFSKN